MRLIALIAISAMACTVQPPERTPGNAGEGGVGEGEGAGEAAAVNEGEGEGPGGGDGDATPVGPVLQITPATLDQGVVTRGERSTAAEVSVLNSGDETHTGFRITLDGDGGFELTGAPSGDDCVANEPLEPGVRCQIGVVFSPDHAGLAVATVRTGDVLALITATGAGFGPAALSAGDVRDHDFGAVEGPVTQRFTVFNVGELPTPPLDAFVEGREYEASEDDCTGTPVKAGEGCSVTVRFSPQDDREHLGALHVFGAGSVEIELTGQGVGLTPGALGVAPVSLEFGEVAADEAGSLPLTLSNAGDLDVESLQWRLVGDHPDDFDATGAEGGAGCAEEGALPGGQQCGLRVSFSPGGPGPRRAALIVGGQGLPDAVLVQLAGDGIDFAPAQIRYVDGAEPFDFGGHADPTTAAFTVENAGASPSRALEVSTAGDAYSVAEGDDGCAGASLAPGERCTVRVTFSPEGAGEHGGIVDIGGAVRELLGEGVGFDPPALTAAPDAHDFGALPPGEAAAPRQVTVRNTGDAPAVGLAWRIEGHDDFDVAPTEDGGCAQAAALDPGAACQLRVGFEPSVAGPRQADLLVSARGLVSGAVRLTGAGQGFGPADLVVGAPANGDPLDFGILDAPAADAITVRNDGASPTGSLSSRLSGDPAFAVLAGDDGCVGRTLPPGGSCAVRVTFTPVGNGAVQASLEVSSPQADGDDSVEIVILGAGEGFRPAALTLDPVDHDFGQIDVGEASEDTFFTLRNTGDLPAVGLRIEVQGDHPLDFPLADVPNGCSDGIDLAGGAACLLGARFVPLGGNARSASLVVTAGDEIRAEAALAGLGHSLLNGDLGGIPFCFERNNGAGHRVGVFNSRNGQNPEQRHNGHADWRSFCQSNGWDDHNRGAGNSNNTCAVLEDSYVTANHLNGGGNWDLANYPPNRAPGRGHVFHTCIISVE